MISSTRSCRSRRIGSSGRTMSVISGEQTVTHQFGTDLTHGPTGLHGRRPQGDTAWGVKGALTGWRRPMMLYAEDDAFFDDWLGPRPTPRRAFQHLGKASSRWRVRRLATVGLIEREVIKTGLFFSVISLMHDLFHKVLLRRIGSCGRKMSVIRRKNRRSTSLGPTSTRADGAHTLHGRSPQGQAWGSKVHWQVGAARWCWVRWGRRLFDDWLLGPRPTPRRSSQHRHLHDKTMTTSTTTTSGRGLAATPWPTPDWQLDPFLYDIEDLRTVFSGKVMSHTSLQEVFGAAEAFSLRRKRAQPKDNRPVSRGSIWRRQNMKLMWTFMGKRSDCNVSRINIYCLYALLFENIRPKGRLKRKTVCGLVRQPRRPLKRRT